MEAAAVNAQPLSSTTGERLLTALRAMQRQLKAGMDMLPDRPVEKRIKARSQLRQAQRMIALHERECRWISQVVTASRRTVLDLRIKDVLRYGQILGLFRLRTPQEAL